MKRSLIIGLVLIMIFHSQKIIVAKEKSLLADEGPMPELGGAVSWINSSPLDRESLRGKVVLVNFWTYSCINSLRELPYIRSWAEKYKDAGLVVIGVHAPEFGFEKDRANVENAVRELKIAFPVPIDSDHRIWRAFDNAYWPADYFIDAKGHIRYHHFGEGEYDKSERVIQELLRENGAMRIPLDAAGSSGKGAEAPPSGDVRSPETYLGYARTEGFASPERLVQDATKSYTPPVKLSLNQWGLGGSWKIGPESAVLQQAGGKIVFRFHSRDCTWYWLPQRARNRCISRCDWMGLLRVKITALIQMQRGAGRLTSRECIN